MTNEPSFEFQWGFLEGKLAKYPAKPGLGRDQASRDALNKLLTHDYGGYLFNLAKDNLVATRPQDTLPGCPS
jgi:hypothetical protein